MENLLQRENGRERRFLFTGQYQKKHQQDKELGELQEKENEVLRLFIPQYVL